MNKYVTLLFVMVLLIFFVFVIIIYDDKEIKQEEEILNYDNTCITQKSIKIVRNNSMEPMISPGEEFELLEGYYDCNEVERGDVVAYDYRGNEAPIIKTVLIIEGDELEFQDNKLLVNKSILKNSAGEEYIFTEKNQKMISLYIKDGKLRDDAYFIFGDNVNSSLDSKNFGAVGKRGFIGKFLID